jgi:membrane protease YdiL (CAAX protease family)
MFREELKKIVEILRGLDRQSVIIFIAIATLQTFSWYFTSRRFFRLNIQQFFPNDALRKMYEFAYWFLGDFITYFIIPLLIIVFIFKKRPSLFGLQIGDYSFGLKVSALFIGIMLPLIWYFSGSQDFIMQYPHLSLARSDWQIFIVYEIGILLYLFAWEFIWRGFTLFGLYEKFGMHAIFIQMIPFVILHNGKPFVETFGAIAGGIILGYFAVRTKSIYYCIVTHAGVMLMIDLIATLRFRASDYGIGLSSILNIIKEIF